MLTHQKKRILGKAQPTFIILRDRDHSRKEHSIENLFKLGTPPSSSRGNERRTRSWKRDARNRLWSCNSPTFTDRVESFNGRNDRSGQQDCYSVEEASKIRPPLHPLSILSLELQRPRLPRSAELFGGLRKKA